MKILEMLSLITVEPALLLYMIANFMSYGVYQDLVYNKICLEHYNHDHSFCDDLTGDALDYVQTQTSYWLQYNNIALLVPSIVAACYLGAWGDRYGRKFPILLANVGTLLGYLIFLIISVYEDSSVYYTLLANFVTGMGGSSIMIVASMMSYVADITKRGSRTSRVSMLESMTSFGSFLGPFISGYLMDGVGYAYTFLFCVGCNTVVFLYLMVRLENVLPGENLVEQNESGEKLASVVSGEVARKKKSGGGCRMGYIADGFRVCFIKREGRKRLYLILLLVCCLCIFMASDAESDLTYLYIMDDPLSGSYKTYSQYMSLKNALIGGSLLIILPLLKRFLHLQDTTLALIGLVSKSAGLILLSFSTNKLMLFFVPVAALFGNFAIASQRAMLSKLVEASEQGKMFSAFATIENIISGVASIMYSNLYPVTRSFFNGFCFILGVCFLLIAMGIIGWMHFEQRRIQKRLPTSDEESQKKN